MAFSTTHEPRILITAGPTLEPLDPVRGILNRSSGKMGLALAQASTRRGLPTSVLLGPVEPAVRQEFLEVAEVEDYASSRDLQGLLTAEWPKHDVLFMASAVSDLRPVEVARSKLPRKNLTLQLEPVPDLLANLARQMPDHGIRIGFALEEQSRLLARAREKLCAKQCHAIAANPLCTIDSNMVSGVWMTAESEVPFEQMAKSAYAEELLNRATRLWSAPSG